MTSPLPTLETAGAPQPPPPGGLPASGWAVVAMGLVSAVVLFDPGLMSYDSLMQLLQARTGRFGDWHPPVMAAVWRTLEHFIAGPFPMLLLQAAAWWIGVALVVHHLAPRRLAPWLTLAIGFWPPVFTMIGTIWKDVQLVSALTLASGLLLAHGRTRSPGALAGACLALFYAGAMRHNAALLVLPLALWAGWALAERCRISGRFARLAATAGLAVALIAAPGLVNRALVQRAEPPIEQALYGWDLLGISVYAGRNLLPHELEPKFYTVGELETFYHGIPLTASVIHHHPQGLHLSYVDPTGIPSYRMRWLLAIQAYPAAYLRHRGEVLRALLGATPSVYYPFHQTVDPNDLAVTRQPSAASKLYFRTMEAIQDGPLFRTWIYLGSLLVCGLFAWRAHRRGRRHARLALLFVAGGLLNFLPLGLIALGADLRYSLWTLVCALFAPLALWAALRNEAPPDVG